MASLSVKVVSPERVLFEGAAASMVAPSWDGRVGILPGHAPFLSLLGSGDLDLDIEGGRSERYYVSGGVLKVLANEVTVLSEYASEEPPETSPHDGDEAADDRSESAPKGSNA